MSSPLVFLDGRVTLHGGDCMDVVKTLPDNSIDAVVTDPPYALVSITKRFGKTSQADDTQTSDRSRKGADGYARLAKGFMGKEWDNGATAFAVEFWTEVMRVLKPGGHLVAFGGTRSYHRLACAIEDAGFEIRDCLMYHYGVGFPKSHNVSRTLDARKERCSCPAHMQNLRGDLDAEESLPGGPKQDVQPTMCGGINQRQSEGDTISVQSTGDDQLRPVRQGKDHSPGVGAETPRELLLQPELSSEGSIGAEADPAFAQGASRVDCRKHGLLPLEDDGVGQSGVEGRRDLSETARQLCEREVRPLPAGVRDDGASGWLRDGASLGDGALDRPSPDANGVRPPQGSRAAEQSEVELGALARQPKPQERGAWDHCERCGKPIIPDGLGTALKPAVEIICLARKPLSEGTVAANVLKWGTGAINVDATRIETDDRLLVKGNSSESGISKGIYGSQSSRDTKMGAGQSLGRWPANIVHDGSAEVLAAFPDAPGQLFSSTAAPRRTGLVYGAAKGPRTDLPPRDHGGSAARFFASFPQHNETRCGLCGLLWTPVSDTDGSCDANSAETSLSTESTRSGASVRCDAVVSPAPESAAKRNPSSARVSNAESSSSPCHPQNQSSVLSNAALLDERRIARNVQSAGNLCGSCATAIAQSLVATRLGQDPVSLPLPDFISGRSAQILKQYLALYVEGRENTDTILTIPSLKMFFGSVFHAIALSTESEESSKDAPIKFGKRFHYDSKAGSDDRLGSKHPTVKPVDLMRWLCRLVTPPGGTVLDPFAGTGTTGEAAWREGFSAVLVEREPEYQADVARRMALCLEGPMVRAHESIKARNVGKPEDNGPLFGGTGLAGGADRFTAASQTKNRTDRA